MGWGPSATSAGQFTCILQMLNSTVASGVMRACRAETQQNASQGQRDGHKLDFSMKQKWFCGILLGKKDKPTTNRIKWYTTYLLVSIGMVTNPNRDFKPIQKNPSLSGWPSPTYHIRVGGGRKVSFALFQHDIVVEASCLIHGHMVEHSKMDTGRRPQSKLECK